MTEQNDFAAVSQPRHMSLRASPMTLAEIGDLAERLSMRLRVDRSFNAYEILLSSPEAFEEMDLPPVAMAKNSENAALVAENGISRGIELTRERGATKFKIFFGRLCSEILMNDRVAKLIANCALHIDYADLPDGRYIVSADDPSEDVKRQAEVFSGSFRNPSPLAETYVGFGHMPVPDFARLIGVEPSEVRELMRRRSDVATDSLDYELT